MIDYHLHSYLCRHGQGAIHQYVESAIDKGLTEIGFAEHIPIPELADPTGRMAIDDWDTYINDVLTARKNYPEITVRLGVEADYLPRHMHFIAGFLADYPFDYVIGSVHFVEDWDFSNPDLAFRLDEFGVNRLYRHYYQLIQEAAHTGLYDIIGHFDLPKKTGVAPTDDLNDVIAESLQSLKKNDLVLDVNTSGLRKEPGEIYPKPAILQQAFTLGIPVTMGSDAHHPREVAADFATTLNMLKHIGYQTCCVFCQRQRSMVVL